MTDFSDLNDSLDDMLDAPVAIERRAPLPTYTKPETYFDACTKCSGTGRTRWGTCFRCKGNGGKTFKTSPEARAKARTAATERKVRTAKDNQETFQIAHPEVAAWIAANPSFEFAAKMGEAIARFGALTPNQLAACERCIARDKQRAAEREAAAKARVESAPTVDITKIEAAFDAAIENGLKFAKLKLDTFTFSLASAASHNAGAVYIKEGAVYLGKIHHGKFICSRECSDEAKTRVVTAAVDPAAAAKAYGLRTGVCSCCGRELTKGESIDRGIGPICAAKYGWVPSTTNGRAA